MKYLGAITSDYDLVNKKYVDDAVSGGGETMYIHSSSADGWSNSHIDNRGLYGLNVAITPVSMDDVNYNDLWKIKAWATPVSNVSTSYYVYPLEVTSIYLNTSSSRVTINVKNHSGNPQSTTAAYIPQSYVVVQTPFEVSSTMVTM